MSLLLSLLLWTVPADAGALVAGGAVSSDHPLASRAGASILAQGGNAVDAAVATALAAGVVQPSASGLGGGGFALVVDPQGAPQIFDFREVAPAGASRGMFAGGEDAPSSRIGGLAVAVPSEGIGLHTLHSAGGRLPWAQVVRPALTLARRGFPVGAHLAASLVQAESAGPALVLALFRGVSGLPAAGQRVSRPSLARALAAFQRQGEALFREGWVAQDMVQAVADSGGLLSAGDLRDYSVRQRPPLQGRYRGWEVTAMPPPSSGGAVLLQVLGVLESWDLAAMERGSAEHWHLLAEAFKHAYADRARTMGDPDRVQVPLRALLGQPRRAAIVAAILPDRTLPSEAYGMPVDPGQDEGTQHISVLDAQGQAVALTTTVNTGFGSRVVAPRSGIVLNNQMDDFVARPGEPNAYGLLGSEANAVAPGARPLSSMSPTVLEHPDGRRIVIGASGGPTIISATLQAIVDLVDFGFSPQQALEAPRMHHQWMPDTLFVEPSVPEEVREGLRARGHSVKEARAFSAVQVVVGGEGRGFAGAADPRKGGASVRPEEL
mgnify:CR=1 FL=1